MSASAFEARGTLWSDAPRRLAGLRKTVRVALGLLMLLGGAFLFVFLTQAQSVEAWLAKHPISWLITDYSSSYGTLLFFQLPDGAVQPFRITAQCSSVILVAPLAGLTGLILFSMRGRVWRIVLAFGVSAALDVGTNVIRLMALAWAYSEWGKTGFDQVHFLYGGIFALGMFGLSFALFLWIALIGGPGRQRRYSTSGEAVS